MIIKSIKFLVNNWYAHVSFPSSISNKRLRLKTVDEELIRFESQNSLYINLSSFMVGVKPTSLPIVK